MNPRRRMLVGMVIMPLVFIMMISATLIKDYFSSNYNDVISSLYINGGNSLLVAVRSSDTAVTKVKFFEMDPTASEIKNSFTVETNTPSIISLKYDNDKALITVINDSEKNAALSVYDIYEYTSGQSKPTLLDAQMQSDTNFKTLFNWRDGLAIVYEDINGEEAALYVKDGVVTKQLLSENADIKNNIKRYANETAAARSDELAYAELTLYSGKTAFVGMFLDTAGNFPIVIGAKDKETALMELGAIAYKNTKVISLFQDGDAYRAGIYSYGKESAKKLLEPAAGVYNASAYYPDMDTTIVIGTEQKSVKSAIVGYVYDNKTGEITRDLSSYLQTAAGLNISAIDDAYICGGVLCIIGDNNYYTLNPSTGAVSTALYTDIIYTINNYDKYQFSTFYDYLMSDQGNALLYNLVLWLAFPLVLLIFFGISRYQKNAIAKRSKLITATITALNQTNIHMYGMTVMDFEVEAYIGGMLKKFNIRNPVPPDQSPAVGQSVVILYNEQTGRATFADDKMVNMALGKPVIEDAVVDNIEKIEEDASGAELLRLYVYLQRDRNIRTIIPAVQSQLLPFEKDETISIRYMANSIEDTAMVLGRGQNTSGRRPSYSGQAEIINVRNVGPAIEGRYIMDIDLVCKTKTGNVYLDNILLTKDTSVLYPGVAIVFAADKELFEKRLRLQNIQQDYAIVTGLRATGDAVGYSPVLEIKLKIISGDGETMELTALENISPFGIPKIDDRVFIGYDPYTKEATIMKRL